MRLHEAAGLHRSDLTMFGIRSHAFWRIVLGVSGASSLLPRMVWRRSSPKEDSSSQDGRWVCSRGSREEVASLDGVPFFSYSCTDTRVRLSMTSLGEALCSSGLDFSRDASL